MTMFVGFRSRVGVGVLLAGVVYVLGLVLVSPALAAQPWWGLSSSSVPAVLKPEGTGQIVLRASNLGDLSLVGSTTPVSITDVLPHGVQATGFARTATGWANGGYNGRGSINCEPTPPAVSFPAASVTCTWAEPFPLAPYELLEVAIDVEVNASAASGAENEAEVSGGEGANAETHEPDGVAVAPVTVSRPITIGTGPVPFGVEEYALANENEGGTPDTQAGSHPFQQTTSIAFNQSANQVEEAPPALPKDLHFQWPAGLIGNSTVLPQCTEAEFSAQKTKGGADLCPADTAVGVASVTVVAPHLIGLETFEVPVFNLIPERGEPARFGFEVEHAAVTIDPSVRTGRDYGVTVSVDNISELVVFVSSRVTVWGVPGDPVHDLQRGWGCVEEGTVFFESHETVSPCAKEDEAQPPPFLTLPTSCTGPLQTTVEADSWQDPGDVLSTSEAMPALGGCNRLSFGASMEVAPDVQSASTPTGLTVKVHVPQEVSTDATGLATSDVKDTTVTLPEGLTLNPAGANGLEACSEAQIGFQGIEPPSGTDLFTSGLPAPKEAPPEPFCPDASKVATVMIDVPILAHPLEGAVYVASQNTNPFGSLVAMYLVAEDPVSGVLVKLAGDVSLNQQTGQVESTFKNTPQAPFEDLELHFFGGERAPLSTPTHCGAYTTNASFAPWSGNAPVNTSTSFAIDSGPNGSACPGSTLPFAPSFTGGTTNLQASAFSDLDTVIGREDGNQDLRGVTLQMPPGLTGLLSGVKLCPEEQANAGTCGPESEIGETTTSVGVGGDPYTVTGGKVYITEKYEGAPFGLSIVTPAVAGPYNLGKVIVRAKIEVNPTTAALTVTTNSEAEGYAIPHILDGIPLQIKHVAVTINRPGFTINPTSCSPMAITTTISSTENASSTVSVPFQITNCANLAFAPKFSVTTSARTSKADGASLISRVGYTNAPQGTQANIAKVKVDLPKQLPSRLTTLQKACLAAVFEANPARCPADSIVGHAVVHTPLIPVPLTGPAYFVSHGGEAFPSLTMVLQGYGVTIDLVGSTFIHDGITSTTFKATPDSPVSSFELVLPEGEYSALTANGNLCHSKLDMPTEFVAQNGAEIHETTVIQVQGCPNTLAITSHSIKNHTITLSVSVPSPGKLTATGNGLSKTTKTTKGHETLKLTLKATNTRKLATKIKLSFTPTKGKKLNTSLTTHLKT